jgi:tight adherence protein B
MKQILIALGALAVVALVEGLYHTVRFFSERRREELRRRLQVLGAPEAGDFTLLRGGKLSSLPFLDELLRGVPLLERLERIIEQAQVNITVAQLLLFSGLSALAGGTIAGILTSMGMGVLCAAIGAAMPLMVVLSIRQKRSQKISEQLPDALDMMARSLRAGHALSSAFKLVASEMPTPMSLEFARAFEEQNLGMSFERAVVNMTARVPGNRDLKIFAVSVIVQKETGGNLVEILEKIGETIRARYRFYGKLRGLTAEGRVSGVVLGILPIGTALIVGLLNPKYLKPLVSDPLGKNLLIYAVLSWIVGVLWLKRMAKVDL